MCAQVYKYKGCCKRETKLNIDTFTSDDDVFKINSGVFWKASATIHVAFTFTTSQKTVCEEK